jgi:septal ring factor EnvC (AmiA/AmiB activator)
MAEKENEIINPDENAEIPPFQEVSKGVVETPKPEPVESKPSEGKGGLPPLARQALRGLLGILIIFLLGFLAAMITLYSPNQNELQKVKTELQQAKEKMTSLETGLTKQATESSTKQKDLASAQEQINTLKGKLDKSAFHVKLLRVLTEIHQAHLALANEDVPFAQLYLKETPKALEELGILLGGEYKDLAKDLQSRLQQALGEMDKDLFAAKSDLSVIEEKLLRLESTLFPPK